MNQNPRKIAVELLDKVLARKLNFDDAFDRDERINTLEQRDKNYLRNLCLTTFRHLGEIDHFLNKFTRAKSNILRLGVCQLKYLDTPPYAAVNEMTELAETKEHKSFINAILRKVPEYEIDRRPSLNISKWMLGSWNKAYGADVVEGFLPFLIKEPSLDLTVKAGVRLQVIGDSNVTRNLTPVTLANGTIRLQTGTPVIEIPGYEGGDWWVQDAASAMAVQMLGDVKGKRVLDMCAAPGGKTAQLCDAGAIVTAVDDSARRLERLHENMARLGFTPEVICADAVRLGEEGYRGNGDKDNSPLSLCPTIPQFDCILVDAPCTATGTAAKNPDLLYTRTQDDVKEMAAAQKKLIAAAHKLLKKGGILVYATCSLQYEEGEGQIKKLEDGAWKLEEEKRILPNHFADFGGTSGFYCAKLSRV